MKTERGPAPAPARTRAGVDRHWLAIRAKGAGREAMARAKVKAKKRGLLAACVIAPLAAHVALAQTMPASPPLPPPRPALPGDAQRAPQPAAPAAPAPRQQDAPIPAPAPPPAANGADAPQISPNVDRAALRACAVEWHRMKETGAAGGLIWRDFAPGCLARKTKGGG